PPSPTQMFPSAMAAMEYGMRAKGYSVIVPRGVTFATLSVPLSVNQIFPSGPATMPSGYALSDGIGYSVKLPSDVSFATLLAAYSVNQRLPSDPTVIPAGLNWGVMPSTDIGP